MRFSPRLAADFTIALFCRALGVNNGHALVRSIALDDQSWISLESASGEVAAWKPFDLDSVVQGSRYRTPIVWIGGTEPLEHPDTPRLANTLAASRRNVFLKTSGVPLKPRLHELQPSSRLYITVRFECSSPSLCDYDSCNAAIRVGLEALRFAHLAGFLTCAYLVVDASTKLDEFEQLRAQIENVGVDGCLINSSVLSPEIARKASNLRRRVLSSPWSFLSRMLEPSLHSSASTTSPEANRETLREPHADSFSEEAQAG
jgi:hypothetical protein